VVSLDCYNSEGLNIREGRYCVRILRARPVGLFCSVHVSKTRVENLPEKLRETAIVMPERWGRGEVEAYEGENYSHLLI